MLEPKKIDGIIRINIPKGVKYLSEIPNFFGQLPNACILNKRKTGCGATTLALTNDSPAIVCEFTQYAVRTKAEALPHTLGVLQGVSTKEIHKYLATCRKEKRVPKFITTMDSCKRLVESIESYINRKHDYFNAYQLKKEFYNNTLFVIDEFQRLLQWGSFKSYTFYEVLDMLMRFGRAVCISATPISKSRIDDLNIKPLIYFDYVELLWMGNGDEYLIQPIKTKKVLNTARALIRMYKEGNYPSIIDQSGELVYSKEVIIFCNSVTDMVNLAASENLPAEQCNFIVARNERNELLLSKAGMGYTIGHVPAKGEASYKYTFITNVGFDVIDLYSDNALSVALSTPCKIKALSIERDLIQLAGRQRNDKNPFRKCIVFIYNTGFSLNENDRSFYKEIMNQRAQNSLLIDDLNKMHQVESKERIWEMMKADSIGQNSFIRYSEPLGEFVLNELAYASALDGELTILTTYVCQQILEEKLQRNGFSKRTELIDLKMSMTDLSMKILPPSFAEGLQRYCFLRKVGENSIYSDWLNTDELRSLERLNPKYRLAYEQLGFERCRALEYKEKKIDAELRDVTILAQQSIISEDKIVFEEVRQALLALPRAENKEQQTACRSIFARYGLDKQPSQLLRIAKKYNLREKQSSSRPRLYSFIE